MKRIVDTKEAPAAIGPYSQGVIYEGRMLYTAGQIGIDPATGNLVDGGIKAQCEQALENLRAILIAGHSSFERVIKVTVYLKEINDFAAFNEVYARYFTKEPPARSTIQVAGLPKDALVEIECFAQSY